MKCHEIGSTKVTCWCILIPQAMCKLLWFAILQAVLKLLFWMEGEDTWEQSSETSYWLDTAADLTDQTHHNNLRGSRLNSFYITQIRSKVTLMSFFWQSRSGLNIMLVLKFDSIHLCYVFGQLLTDGCVNEKIQQVKGSHLQNILRFNFEP